MKAPTLAQFSAVQAFASESIDGVTREDIAGAIGDHFGTSQDANNAGGILLCLGYLQPVSYPKSEDGKTCLMPDRVIGAADETTRLRDLHSVVQMIKRNGGRCRVYRSDGDALVADGHGIGDSIRHLEVMQFLTVERINRDGGAAYDRIQLLSDM